MTLRNNARVAGVAFLLYIAFAFPSMMLFGRATSGEAMPAKLSNVADHAANVRISVLLSVLCCFCALTLAATLYRLTRDVDPDLARIAMLCRAGEGIVGGAALPVTAAVLWVATAMRAGSLEAVSAQSLAAFLLKAGEWNTLVGSILFAAGSTLFAWLFLRGRLIPVWLAWVGVIGSALVLLVIWLRLAGLAEGLVTQVVWLPVAIFELVLAFRLILKGTAAPATPRS
ncbi:MAG TPA: DUF4386 domain-containing protein [Thermoanaerobaculia bacterium]|nr:DUF4386 domain-containing protein [Thermoanaerobaculia bacterium]